MKRILISTTVVAALLVTLVAQDRPRPFTVVEASIADMHDAMAAKRVTSVQLVTEYLTRLAIHEDLLHAALSVSRDALKDAAERDRERTQGRVRGRLHGIPIAVKDNIHTTTMPTTGGALAFEGFVPSYEAMLVTNLRQEGAIIIAKTGMTELANWVAEAMPGNYNALGGFGFNPYDPRRDRRPPPFSGRPVLGTGGSSSGIGTAANLWAGNVGTETSGSILSPANQTMLVGLKPTVGRISRYGVIPIVADQDTPGPMTKTVADAALMFGVLEGRTRDPRDAATTRCAPPANGDYTSGLSADALRGARIGIPRAFFYDRMTPAFGPARGGLPAEQARVMTEAIDVLRRRGAVVVDPANIPSAVDANGADNVLNWSPCSGANQGPGRDADCSSVLKYGMKRDFNAWLGTLGPAAPVQTLTELRQWNQAHEAGGAIRYGQANLDISDAVDLARDRAKYEADRAKDLRLTAAHGIDEVMRSERLDALLFPGANGAALAARPGYPTVIVPFGMVSITPSVPFPAGVAPKPSPYGVSFTGLACSEPRLLALAYAFEQATKKRVPPPAVTP